MIHPFRWENETASLAPEGGGRDVMNVAILLNAAGVIMATTAALAALLAAPDESRRIVDAAVVPVGWKRVVVMHVIASLPLSWVLAHVLARRFPGWTSRLACVFWIALGLATALWTAARGETLGHALNAGQADYLLRLVVRTAWCVALQLPWCLAAMAAPRADVPRTSSIPLRHVVPLALIVAVLMPVGYLDRLIEQQTLLARAHCGNRHYASAWDVLTRLCDLGSRKNLWEVDIDGNGTIHEYPPRASLAILNNDIARARHALKTAMEQLPAAHSTASPGKAVPPPMVLLALAENLASLGEFDEARTVIEPLAESDARAAVVRAQIDEQQGEWEGANAWFRKALEIVQSRCCDDPLDDETRVAIQVQAYNVLAHNARELDRYDIGEQTYFEAMDRLPSHKAYYHHQLGRHYELWGRPFKAVAHFAAAHELSPRQYAPPESALLKVLASGAPIGLFRPDASNYE